MPANPSEREFEQAIEAALLAGGPDDPARGPRRGAGESGEDHPAYGPRSSFVSGGYHRRKPEDYDRDRCLVRQDVFSFIYATQPKEWEKFAKLHGADAKDRFIGRLASQVAKRGTVDVLRGTFKCDGCRFRMAYFPPASGLNPELQKLHASNMFAVVRQLHYSVRTESSVDLTLFLNGLPIITAELKNPLTGQDVTDAVRQYRLDRDPREPFFAFGRCLAHFAIDPDLVYFTTELKGPATDFRPFNQGNAGGAGNPPAPAELGRYSTAYLWERIWARDSILGLVQNFVHVVDILDDKGRKTGKRELLFPRYHQLDAVRKLVRHPRENGAGQKYLVQHSAGSGKSNSIAWLAHQLAVLHGADDRKVFDSVVIITDRRILDRQLQRTVAQFEQVDGMVENIDKTSRQLKAALESGKRIIVTTLQKFPVIAGEIGDLPGKRFAVVIDEAHSSQAGESTKSMKAVLAVETLEEAEDVDAWVEDPEDQIIAEMKKRGQTPNVSYFAFTATPKSKTMELFGTRQLDGSFVPFHLYSMRQAIDERYILDVLENYATYKTYWSLLKKVQGDPRYEKRKASLLLRSFVELSDHAIERKVAIMVGHFHSQVAGRIDGHAKAMIVTRSRMHTVRYKLALDRYLREHRYPYEALVAFSGTVHDGGADFTESGMNGGIPETQTADTFKQDEYRFLVVANKFQTGFDQPLLHTMYVDKRLTKENAVQTLSRLNRIHPGKDETMVLDFANDPDVIREGFQRYYDRTVLPEATDPNQLHDIETRLEDFHMYTREEVNAFARLYFAPKPRQEDLYAALEPVRERFVAADHDDKVAFRATLADYVRLYAFLAQILPFADADLEKLHVFGRTALRRLTILRDPLPVEIQRQIDMDSYRVDKKHEGSISLQRGKAELPPTRAVEDHKPPEGEMEVLSKIIKDLNDRFGTSFSENDRVSLSQLEAQLDGDPGLLASVANNVPENARLTFDHVAREKFQDMIDSNFRLYKEVTDNEDFSKLLFDWLFDRYRKRALGA